MWLVLFHAQYKQRPENIKNMIGHKHEDRPYGAVSWAIADYSILNYSSMSMNLAAKRQTATCGMKVKGAMVSQRSAHACILPLFLDIAVRWRQECWF